MSGKVFYEFKSGFQVHGTDAQTVGEELAALSASQGGLTPARLVDRSRDLRAPLHGCFEWDDIKGAALYREEQARYLMRSVVVARIDGDDHERAVTARGPVRAFVRVPDTNGYEPIQVVIHDRDKREGLLRQAKADMAVFVRKYRALSELDGVMAAIEGYLEGRAPLQANLWDGMGARPTA